MAIDQLALRSDAVSWTSTETSEIVVLDLRTSRYLSLNASGSTLWHLLADGTDVLALRAALSATFGLDGPTAERDVDAFLSELRTRDLLAT